LRGLTEEDIALALKLRSDFLSAQMFESWNGTDSEAYRTKMTSMMFERCNGTDSEAFHSKMSKRSMSLEELAENRTGSYI
jgi:hypothetical protein